MLLIIALIVLLALIYLMNINDNLDKILKELVKQSESFKNVVSRKEGDKK